MPLMVTIQPWLFITTSWSRQYDFNLVCHPTWKKSPGGIRTRDSDHDSRTYTHSRPLGYGPAFKRREVLVEEKLFFYNISLESVKFCSSLYESILWRHTWICKKLIQLCLSAESTLKDRNFISYSSSCWLPGLSTLTFIKVSIS